MIKTIYYNNFLGNNFVQNCRKYKFKMACFRALVMIVYQVIKDLGQLNEGLPIKMTREKFQIK